MKTNYNNPMVGVQYYKNIKYSSHITSDTHKDNKCDQSVQLNLLMESIKSNIEGKKLEFDGKDFNFEYINLLLDRQAHNLENKSFFDKLEVLKSRNQNVKELSKNLTFLIKLLADENINITTVRVFFDFTPKEKKEVVKELLMQENVDLMRLKKFAPELSIDEVFISELLASNIEEHKVKAFYAERNGLTVKEYNRYISEKKEVVKEFLMQENVDLMILKKFAPELSIDEVFISELLASNIEEHKVKAFADSDLSKKPSFVERLITNPSISPCKVNYFAPELLNDKDFLSSLTLIQKKDSNFLIRLINSNIDIDILREIASTSSESRPFIIKCLGDTQRMYKDRVRKFAPKLSRDIAFIHQLVPSNIPAYKVKAFADPSFYLTELEPKLRKEAEIENEIKRKRYFIEEQGKHTLKLDQVKL